MLVGINLLREGLDMPKVALVAILDADKEGFLRRSALIQTIGRAARNVNGRAVLYADQITESMKKALGETERRREKQLGFNEANGITPQTIRKAIADVMEGAREEKGEPKKGGKKGRGAERSAYGRQPSPAPRTPERPLRPREGMLSMRRTSSSRKPRRFGTRCSLKEQLLLAG